MTCYLKLIIPIFMCLVSLTRFQAQEIVVNCNDDLIRKHFELHSHPYCFHTCGSGVIEAICMETGECHCVTNVQVTDNPDPELCNSKLQKENPILVQNCMETCLAENGSTSILCEDSTEAYMLYYPAGISTAICQCRYSRMGDIPPTTVPPPPTTTTEMAVYDSGEYEKIFLNNCKMVLIIWVYMTLLPYAAITTVAFLVALVFDFL